MKSLSMLGSVLVGESERLGELGRWLSAGYLSEDRAEVELSFTSCNTGSVIQKIDEL